ncbi:MAG: hypothetical protein WC795_02760 [Candidatus Paceibacterota bacterium]|jgi:DNA polymerase III delta subunit
MIYFFYGSDSEAKRAAAEYASRDFIARHPASTIVSLHDTELTREALEAFAGGAGLFSEFFVVMIDRAIENKMAREFVLEKAEVLAGSLNLFIMNEYEATKEVLDVFKKLSEKVLEFKKVENKKEKFNIFSLTDAFARKSKREAWVLYRQAVVANVSPEEVAGILIWQVKTMLMVKLAGAKAEILAALKLNPFVLKKTQSANKNFTEIELKSLSSRLVRIFHEGHAGRDMGLDLEQFILEVL